MQPFDGGVGDVSASSTCCNDVCAPSGLLAALRQQISPVMEIRAKCILEELSQVGVADLLRALAANTFTSAFTFEGLPCSLLVGTAEVLKQKPRLRSLILRDLERCTSDADLLETPLNATATGQDAVSQRNELLDGCPDDETWAATVQMLSMSSSLHSLHLEGVELGNLCGLQVAAALRSQHNCIRSLTLVGYALGDASGLAIAAVLDAQGSQLESLTFIALCAGDTTGVAIAKALTRTATLRHLTLEGVQPILYGCQMGDETGLAMAEMLSHNISLLSLSLRGNRMGDATGLAMAKALERNATLRRLHLWGYALSDVGGTAVASALRQRRAALLDLGLEGCCIGDETVAELATTVRTETCTLQRLAVDGGRLNGLTTFTLLNALKQNTVLRSLKLPVSIMCRAAWLDAAEVLEQNISLQHLILGGSRNDITAAAVGDYLDQFDASVASSAVSNVQARERVEELLRRNRELPVQWVALRCVARDRNPQGICLGCWCPVDGSLSRALTELCFQRSIFTFFLPPCFRNSNAAFCSLPIHFGGQYPGCWVDDDKMRTI
eukprot:TRINITY_DN67538_c0_g1_i1.p1 TRINITY_DN67538_c0_g1~~TRINITY_DN67538_c0_g1_i1.p1  ORF type:complete len:555 (+),score=90.28 TRINITY_DN67538_c0_g1_i1:79-1743(+)